MVKPLFVCSNAKSAIKDKTSNVKTYLFKTQVMRHKHFFFRNCCYVVSGCFAQEQGKINIYHILHKVYMNKAAVIDDILKQLSQTLTTRLAI